MKILIVILSLAFFVSVRAEERYREPFESMLPVLERVGPRQRLRLDIDEIIELPVQVVVEGTLWGIERPQAVINGKVYFVGDTINGTDVVVYDVKESIVFLSYRHKIFEKKVGAVETPEREEEHERIIERFR